MFLKSYLITFCLDSVSLLICSNNKHITFHSSHFHYELLKDQTNNTNNSYRLWHFLVVILKPIPSLKTEKIPPDKTNEVRVQQPFSHWNICMHLNNLPGLKKKRVDIIHCIALPHSPYFLTPAWGKIFSGQTLLRLRSLLAWSIILFSVIISPLHSLITLSRLISSVGHRCSFCGSIQWGEG